MFGYIRAYAPEMKIRCFENYRGIYCGLCKSHGRCTGCTSKLTLSYDFVFMAAVRMALSGTETKFTKRRCFLHPLKKRNMLDGNAELEYCSYASALLTYYKCRDDISDEKGMKKFRSRLYLPFAKGMRRRALAKFPELDIIISGGMKKLSALEKENNYNCTVNGYAAVFGEMLAEIMRQGYDGGKAKIAGVIGKCVGKWIYITDAVDDYEKDIKKKRFNPFIAAFGDEKDTEYKLSDSQKEGIFASLECEMLEAVKAADLIDFTDGTKYLGEIIENILYLGMPETVKRILGLDRTEKKIALEGRSDENERSV